MEGDSVDAIKWTSGKRNPSWKLLPVVREIWALCVTLDVSFKHERRSVNGVAGFLAKMKVDRELAILKFF